MRKIDRSGQRRHGLDASAFNSSMFFGWFFLECPCRIAVPIDRAERLEGFGCIRLHRHQVVSVVDFDDAAGGISDCVQRVYRDNMSGCGKACKDDPLGGKSASSLTHLVWLQKLLFVVQRWKGKRG